MKRILEKATALEARIKARFPDEPGHLPQCTCHECTALFIRIGFAISAFFLTRCVTQWWYGVDAAHWIGEFQVGWNGLIITCLMWLKERKEHGNLEKSNPK